MGGGDGRGEIEYDEEAAAAAAAVVVEERIEMEEGMEGR